nr:DUF3604 domain-containing protein [Methyloceanibacter methanicus]
MAGPGFRSRPQSLLLARVIEIPTPRWTAYDAAYFKESKFDPDTPMTVTERAYTSPIWYAPKG